MATTRPSFTDFALPGGAIPMVIPPSLASDAAQVALTAVSLSRYTLFVSFVFAIYDWLLNLDKEVELVMFSSWTLVKGAYLFSRYYLLFLFPLLTWALVLDHTQETCERVYRFTWFSIIPAMFSSQLILLLRTYAFTGRKPWVMTILSLSLACVFLTTLTIFIKSLELITAVFQLLGRSGCFASTNLRNEMSFEFGAIFLCVFCFDMLNVTIIIWYCITERSILGELGFIIIAQALFYYIFTTTLNILTAVLYLRTTRQWNGSGSWFAYILPNVMACRLVLMLRERAARSHSEDMMRANRAVENAIELMDIQRENGDKPIWYSYYKLLFRYHTGDD